VAKDLEPSRGLAYSTISTTLDRLYKKGMLGRDEAIGRGGSRYIYMLHSEEKVKGKVVKGFVDRLLTAFGPTVISTLSDYVDDIPKDELKRLEEKIRKGSKQRST
jgi:predicted transcriptional regulator